MTAPRDVLDFWFGVPGTPDWGRARPLWFAKSQAVDAEIRARFGAAVEAALRGAFEDWRATPRGALALILLLDQFTRNVFRDTPRAFAGDARALATARALIERGDDLALTLYERHFAYLPFEHAEDHAAQQMSLRLFAQLASDGLPEAFEWAQKHYEVIARFGRYPHRNAILGRESTPEERAFLEQPGSRF
jgi:uncharacterized protein (DUF924 family)